MANKRRARLGALMLVAVTWRVAAQQPRVTLQHSGVHALLQSVSAVDDHVVWVGGAAGTVLRTVDGGDTWETRPIPGASGREFRGIEALNAREAWALSIGTGTQSRIYHTTDGGTNWTEQFVNPDSTAFFDCITFFDAKRGVVFSDASRGRTVILRTDDGGSHWAFLPASAVPAPLPGEGGFASSNSCIVHADRRRGWIAASEPGARIFGTGNAGSTWSVIAATTPFVHDSAAGITAISFRDAKHGIGVAARVDRAMARDTSPAAVATTSDGGATWTLRHRPPQPGSLSGVALVPGVSDATAVIAGYGGVFVTRDNGDHWTMLDPGGYWAVRAAGRRAWSVGTDGRIARIDF